jgi:hypothetical protein
MNHLLAILVVTVMGAGGPHKVQSFRLTDGVIHVAHSGVTVASSKSGRLKVRLQPGRYLVSAALQPPNPSRPCEVKSVRLKPGQTTRLSLHCSIR